MRIRNSVLVLVLSLGLPGATLISEPAYGQAAQPTAEELYTSGMELYKAGELKEAQTVLRKVDPLQLPRDKQPSFYNALFEIDQKLNAPEPETVEPEVTEPEVTEPEVTEPEVVEPEVAEPVKPDAASLLRQADALAENNPAEALSVYQQVLADEEATPQQKATAQARVAGIERDLNGDITGARRLIALAEQDIVNDDLDAAESKLNSVKNSGIELGFFDSESVNKKLALISDVRTARAAAAEAEALAAAERQKEADRLAAMEAENNKPEAGDDAELAAAQKKLAEAEAAAAKAEADKKAMEAQLAAAQRKLEENQVAKGAPVSDLMIQARANTAAEKAEQADKALRTGQLNAAVQLYEDATLLDPDNELYQSKLAEAKTKLNEQMRPIGIGDQTSVDRRVRYQAAVAEYEKAMAKATNDLEKQDFLAASNSVVEARTILARERQVFPADEYTTRTNRSNQLQSLIDTTKARVDANQLLEIEKIRDEDERRIAVETEQRKIEEIQGHLRKARALQLENKYEDALTELDAALFLEPQNPVLKALRDMIQDTAFAVESFELKRDRDLEIASLTLLNIEASTPFADILTYPGDWPELTAIRLRGLDNDAGESETNRAAQAALRKIVTLSNDNLSLDQVISFIRDTTGANIAVNWNALELVGIDQDSLITISLSRVPAEQLLRLVLEQVSADAFDDDKAGFTVSEGIVKISTLRDLKSETETRVYDIRDLLVQVPNFTNAPGFDLNEALSNTSSGGSNSGSGGGGGGSGGGGGKGAAVAAMKVTVQQLYKVASHLRPIFGEEAVVNKERLWSEEECAQALRQYAEGNALTGADVSHVKLDELLMKGLHGKKEEVEIGMEVELTDLTARLMKKMQLHNRVLLQRGDSTEEVIHKGEIKNVFILAEDRHAGRKFITKVSNLEYFGIEPKEFATAIQKLHNTSTSIEKLPGKNETGMEVAMQGNLLNEAEQFLTATYGLAPGYIEKKSRMK